MATAVRGSVANGGSHGYGAETGLKLSGDATDPALAAVVPDLNTDSRTERFTTRARAPVM